jgi:hypothetical protein
MELHVDFKGSFLSLEMRKAETLWLGVDSSNAAPAAPAPPSLSGVPSRSLLDINHK